jgi:predicted GNAT family N-acyltransferase
VTGPVQAAVATAADWPEVAALRHRVFVLEQGVPEELERDDADATAVHALSRDDAGRVLAVLHREAAARGQAEVELHAQVTARRFYERAGYAPVGEEYEEAGIRHITMRRRLDAGPARTV